MPAWLQYTLIRLGIFAVVFALLLLLDIQWFVAALIAAVVGFCVGYIFFRDLRLRMAAELANARSRRTVDPDADAEDGAHPDR